MEESARRRPSIGRVQYLWLYRMILTPHPLAERMTLAWHGHFATGQQKVDNPADILARDDRGAGRVRRGHQAEDRSTEGWRGRWSITSDPGSVLRNGQVMGRSVAPLNSWFIGSMHDPLQEVRPRCDFLDPPARACHSWR
jgi:hypothetical protein